MVAVAFLAIGWDLETSARSRYGRLERRSGRMSHRPSLCKDLYNDNDDPDILIYDTLVVEW